MADYPETMCKHLQDAFEEQKHRDQEELLRLQVPQIRFNFWPKCKWIVNVTDGTVESYCAYPDGPQKPIEVDTTGWGLPEGMKVTATMRISDPRVELVAARKCIQMLRDFAFFKHVEEALAEYDKVKG